jgi:two-component system, sensor histidine kinase and response regulator
MDADKAPPVSALPVEQRLDLRAYFSRWAWLCMGPLLLLAVLLAVDHVHQLNTKDKEVALRHAKNFAVSLDNRLQARIGSLKVLADSDQIHDPRQWPTIYRYAQNFQREFGNHVILADSHEPMRMLLNTRLPYGGPLPLMPKSKGRSAAPEAVATGKPAVGDIVQGPIANKPLLAIAVPVKQGDATPYVLLALTDAEEYQRRVDSFVIPKDWRLTLLDGNKQVIARRTVANMDDDAGSADSFSVPMELSSWTVVIEIPRSAQVQVMLITSMGLGVAILFALLAGHFGSKMASRQLSKEVAALGDISAPVKPFMLAETADARRLLDSLLEQRSQVTLSLSEERERLAGILRGTNSGTWEWNVQTGKTVFNERWAEMIGYSLAEISPVSIETWMKFAHPVDLEKSGELLQRHFTGELDYYECEARLKHRDGHWIWVLDRGRVTSWTEDGKPLMMMGTHQDITQRKETELQLQKLSLAVEQISVSIVITNLEAKIEYVNDAFLRNSGYAREEILGKNPRILHSGKSPRSTYETLWAALKHGETWVGDFYNQRKDGSESIEHAIVTPMRDLDGQMTHYVSVQEDVTERRRIALELEQHRHHLEDMVEERTVELAEAKAKAEVANQAKSAFLANMSHEIRTPLNAIIGLSYLLRSAERAPEQIVRLDKISNAGRHLLALINDILDLSRIESGHLELESADFHLSSIFDNVRSLIAEAAAAKGLAIEIDTDHVPMWLCGDLTRLRQILLNFSSNAVKFTESGRISLRANLLAEHDGQLDIRFEVQDSGIGISPETQAKLFQVFEQGDASVTRKYGGSGLGLAIARRLAELMGGTVGVESTLGAGSTFWLKVSLKHGHGVMPTLSARSGSDAADILRRQHSGCKVLLVEDNEINREVALELLHAVGLDADSAENGAVAVNRVQQKAYDLILMDMQMPVMNGLDATRLIRKLPGMSALPILAMTANAFTEDRQACLDAGMDHFVAKPVDPPELYKALVEWLSRMATVSEPLSDDPTSFNPQDAELGRGLATNCLQAGLNISLGLRALNGNASAYFDLLHRFARQHRGDAASLEKFINSGARDAALQVAHTLKGTAATIGAMRLATAATDLEDALRRSDPSADLLSHLSKVRTSADALWVVIETLPVKPEKVVQNVDPARVVSVLIQLQALLEADDTQAIAIFEQDKPVLLAAMGPAVLHLQRQMESFDFPAAVTTVRELISRARALVDKPVQPSSPAQW